MAEDYDATVSRIRRLAFLSVGRGCFFAALAIWCCMVGLVYEPPLALKCGAVLTLITAAALLLKGQYVLQQSYKQTEIWILLDRKLDLLPAHAQRVITHTLHEIYRRYALFAGLLALVFWLLSLLFGQLLRH